MARPRRPRACCILMLLQVVLVPVLKSTAAML
jgi:hypothetical protein